MSEPKLKHMKGQQSQKPHHDIPSPILKELLELKEKMRNLEVMMELILKTVKK